LILRVGIALLFEGSAPSTTFDSAQSARIKPARSADDGCTGLGYRMILLA